ncbi:MAG: hypothetical protein LUH56_02960 [Oscillospiraceae bacterium]|nr:hypothetical protein [Oscillospiraceae bacterium]
MMQKMRNPNQKHLDELPLSSDIDSGEILLSESGECDDTLTTWILFEIKR